MHQCSLPLQYSHGPQMGTTTLSLLCLLSPRSLARGRLFLLYFEITALCAYFPAQQCLGGGGGGQRRRTRRPSPPSRSLSDDAGGAMPGSAASGPPAPQLLPPRQGAGPAAGLNSESTAELAASGKNMKGRQKLILKFQMRSLEDYRTFLNMAKNIQKCSGYSGEPGDVSRVNNAILKNFSKCFKNVFKK